MEKCLDKFCYTQSVGENDMIFINYIFLKQMFDNLTTDTDGKIQNIYNIVLQKIIDTIDDVLIDNLEFSMNFFLKDLVIRDINRHRNFIVQMANVMKTRYQDKLRVCYIHQAPFVFQQVFTIINPFLDTKTKNKIIVTNSKSLTDADINVIRDSLETYTKRCNSNVETLMPSSSQTRSSEDY